MAGNVWQWVGDWFGANYYSNSIKDDPKGPDSGKERVARGGSFASDPKKHLRISYREKFEPKPLDNVGFRCVLEDGVATRNGFGAGK
jgi:formylglycine-generating enzyme required for sulfatase activity